MRSSLKEEARVWVADIFPRKLGCSLYGGLLSAIVALARAELGREAQIWARHSYVVGGFKPIASDLDLTLWLTAAPQGRAVNRFLLHYQVLRKACPILGELNLYVDSEARRFRDRANPLELARDPHLFQELGIPREPNLPERAAFILRMAEADALRLDKRPRQRREKWTRHFEAGKMQAPKELSITSVCAAVAEALIANPERRAEFTEKTSRYLRERAFNAKHWEIPAPSIVCHSIPQHCSWREEFTAPIPMDLVGLCHAQIRWEIWGLLSQYRALRRNPETQHHLVQHYENLKKATGMLKEQACGEVSKQELETLILDIEFLRKMNDFEEPI